MSGYPETRGAARLAGRDKITVGGVDVTFLRGSPTPFPRYTLTEPFAYGATSLQFPQVHAGYEAAEFGQPGDLSWVRKGARVVISRVFEDDSVTVDYVGKVIAVEPYGRVLNLDIGGEFSGPASLLERQNQMFRYDNDCGHWAQLAAAAVGLHFSPWNGPVTGIRLTHAGGQSHLSWTQYVCAMSQDEDGTQRALMPTAWGSTTWEFQPKDYDDIAGTIYNDDARAVLQVVDDASEQPNVIYGTGITPDGVRITNAKWPGVFSGPAPDYPMAGGIDFGLGTDNADTVNGDGISVLYSKLVNMGYVPFNVPDSGTFDANIVKGVKKLQADASVTQTGVMSVARWNDLFDNDVTGYSINGAYIAPMAEDPRVRKYNRTSNGSIAGLNPLYDALKLRVERSVDFGAGITKGAMIAHCRGLLARSLAAKNWVGTIRLAGVGAFTGMHDGEQAGVDALNADPDAIISYRDIRPGENYWFPLFDGGTRFHVSGVDVDNEGATLTVDTQARDLVEVREILARNAESRRDVRREWNAANRPSRRSTAMVTSDENFGELDRNVSLVGGQWNRVPVITGQQGQVNRVDIRLVNDAAKFAVAAVGRNISEQQMQNKVGNPLTTTPESVWETSDIQDWFDDKILLYAAGDGKQPCGYGRRRYRNDDGDLTGAPLTGRLLMDTNWSYFHVAHTAVITYLFIYPDRDCVLKKGKLLYCQLNDAF